MPRYDKDQVKEAARGRWAEILVQVTGISDDFFTTAHRDCPKCGGSDRWRVFNDFAETGGGVCNQCGKQPDGLQVVRWYLGVSFPRAIEVVAEYLHVPGLGGKGKGKQGWSPTPGLPAASRPAISESEIARRATKRKEQTARVEPAAWNAVQVLLWCRGKAPLSPESIRKKGAKCAKYQAGKRTFDVIALPARDDDGQLTGWILYNLRGGFLPGPKKQDGQFERLKVKVLGSGFGHIEPIENSKNKAMP